MTFAALQILIPHAVNFVKFVHDSVSQYVDEFGDEELVDVESIEEFRAMTDSFKNAELPNTDLEIGPAED